MSGEFKKLFEAQIQAEKKQNITVSVEEDAEIVKDYKTELNTLAQRARLSVKYKTLLVSAEKNGVWEVQGMAGKECRAIGVGSSLKAAEQDAARQLIPEVTAIIRNFNRERAQRSREKGRTNEQRVIDSFKHHAERVPEWIASVRLATSEEDHMGIDVVVETKDVGPVFLQVKSSFGGETKFLVKRGSSAKLIATIVVRELESGEDVFQNALRACEELRTEILRRRGR